MGNHQPQMWLLRSQRILQAEEKTKLVMQDAFKKVPPFQGVTSQSHHPSPSPSPSPEWVKGPSNQTYHPSSFTFPPKNKKKSKKIIIYNLFYLFYILFNFLFYQFNLSPFPFCTFPQ